MMEAPKFRKVAYNITNCHLQKIGEVVVPQHIFGSLDRIGVSHKGWVELFNIMKDGLHCVDKKLKLKVVPNPFQVCPRHSMKVLHFSYSALGKMLIYILSIVDTS